MKRTFKRIRAAGLALALGLLSAVAVRAGPQDAGPDELYQAGLAQFAAGGYADAAKNFQDLITRFGGEPSMSNMIEAAYYGLGCCQYNQGQYPEAITTFQSYIQKYPGAKLLDEALFRIGAAQQAGEAYDAALAAYQDLLNRFPRSPFAEDAAFQIGLSQMLNPSPPAAAEAFERFRQNYPESDLFAQATMFKARAQFAAEKLKEAVDTLSTLENYSRNWDHLVYVNFLAVEIGDAAYDNTDYDLALRAYRRVRPRESLLRLQRRVVAGAQAALDAFRKEPAAPQAVMARFRRERRLTAALAQAQDLQQKLEAMPDYDAGLYHRIGRCFMNNDRYWEARVAFERVVAEARDEKIREAAHYDLILVLARMRRFDDLIGEADQYLARYDVNPKR